MNNQNEIVKRLRFENWIWIVYIIISLVTILGDELIIKSIQENNNKYNEDAIKLFKSTLVITIIIYIYFLVRNYSDYINSDKDNKQAYGVRLLGSILMFIGTLCLFYFLNETSSVDDSVSNI